MRENGAFRSPPPGSSSDCSGTGHTSVNGTGKRKIDARQHCAALERLWSNRDRPALVGAPSRLSGANQVEVTHHAPKRAIPAEVRKSQLPSAMVTLASGAF